MSVYGKETLLKIVQDILEKMDSDEVNSISDTVESIAVANEVKDTFRFITANNEDYQKKSYTTLKGVSDKKYFNQLKLPDHVVKVIELWFDDGCGKRNKPLYLPPEEFVERLFQGDRTQECYRNVSPIGSPNGPFFPVATNKKPEYYTTFDDVHLFFDSVDLTYEDTIKASGSAAYVVSVPEFRVEDTFIPPLNVDDFSYLKNEAINSSFVHFKGVSNSVAQKRARDQKVQKQTNRERAGIHTNRGYGPPYGRHSRGRSVQNISRNGS